MPPNRQSPLNFDKNFWCVFRVKKRDFSAVLVGFDFTANYLEMNKII